MYLMLFSMSLHECYMCVYYIVMSRGDQYGEHMACELQTIS